ncbi:hypothetical protein Taro_046247, partial [Colocasia esculenta]|nr:hypothetical protein [Colocasia esculenta]
VSLGLMDLNTAPTGQFLQNLMDGEEYWQEVDDTLILLHSSQEVLIIYFVEDNAMKWWKEMRMYRWMTTCLEVKLPGVIDSGMNWPPGYGYNTLLEGQLHTKIVGIYKTMVARTIV